MGRKIAGVVLLVLALGAAVSASRRGLPAGGSEAYRAGYYVGLGLGGAFGVAGLYMLLTDGNERSGKRRRTKRRGEGRDDLVVPSRDPAAKSAPKKRRPKPPPGFG